MLTERMRECWGPPANCRHRIVTVFALSNFARGPFGATSAWSWDELRRGRAFVDELKYATPHTNLKAAFVAEAASESFSIGQKEENAASR